MSGFIRYGWTAVWTVLFFGTRAAVGLSIAAVIFRRLAPEQSSGLFQLIFLQSAFIAFISASGFVRSVKHAHNGGDSAIRLRTHGLFTAKASFGALIIVMIFLPRGYLGVSLSEQMIVCIMIVAGGASTALSGILQGAVVLSIGKSRTFGCLAGANVASFFAVALLAVVPDPVVAAFALFVSQTLGFVALATFLPEGRNIVISSMKREATHENDALLSTGTVNTLQLLALFVAREIWKDNVAAEISSLVFFVMRISDMVLQVLYIVFSSTPRMVKAFTFMAKQIGTVTIFVAVSIIPFVVYIYVLSGTVSTVFAVIAFELATLSPRIFATMMSISTLYEDDIRFYVSLIISSIVALGSVMFAKGATGPLTIQLAVFAMAVTILASGIVVQRIMHRVAKNVRS